MKNYKKCHLMWTVLPRLFNELTALVNKSNLLIHFDVISYCAYCVLMLSTSLLSVMKTPVYPSKKILSFLSIKNANTY